MFTLNPTSPYGFKNTFIRLNRIHTYRWFDNPCEGPTPNCVCMYIAWGWEQALLHHAPWPRLFSLVLEAQSSLLVNWPKGPSTSIFLFSFVSRKRPSAACPMLMNQRVLVCKKKWRRKNVRTLQFLKPNTCRNAPNDCCLLG